MTRDIVKRLRARADELRGFGSIAHIDANTDEEAACCIEELREHLFLTANMLQDSMNNNFFNSHSDNWIEFCRAVITNAKKLSKDN